MRGTGKQPCSQVRTGWPWWWPGGWRGLSLHQNGLRAPSVQGQLPVPLGYSESFQKTLLLSGTQEVRCTAGGEGSVSPRRSDLPAVQWVRTQPGGRTATCAPRGGLGVAEPNALCVPRGAGGHVAGTGQTWVPLQLCHPPVLLSVTWKGLWSPSVSWER